MDGDYEFELEVKDSRGLTGKDTVLVNVELKPDNTDEIIFKDIEWGNDWYSVIYINQFKYIVEPGRPFKVYIQRGDNLEWIKVNPWPVSVNELYDYQINYSMGSLGILAIYSLSQIERTKASVKIVFE